MQRFDGKTVIVTGASSGIGRATAALFASEGANVVAVGRDEAKTAQALADVPAGRLLAIGRDIADPATGAAVVEQALERFGSVDVLVNNAGTFAGSTVEETEDAQFNRVIAVNVGGYWHMAKAAIPELKKTKGAIVQTSSVSGLGGDWGMAAYNTSKGAVTNMTRAMALDLGRDGVRVNAVCPSFTRTGMTGGMEDDEALMAKFRERIPMGRPGEPEDVARVILFLASDEAGFVTGVNLPVDGGLSASNGQPAQ